MKQETADLLLSGGHVIDTANNIDAIMDVAIKNGVIAAMENSPSHLIAKTTVDVRGLYVVPGLIDMHCHVYPRFPPQSDSLPCIDADAHMLAQGVTTCVDAGTCGIRDFIRFKETIIDHSRVRILAMLNIADGGMVNLQTEQNPCCFHPDAVAGMAKAFKELVAAIKTAHYWVDKPFDDEHPAWASADSTLEAAELCGLPAMFDFQPTLPMRSYEELILKKMRRGDIHTHVFAQQFPIIDDSGKLNHALIEARENGVLFDLGHGAGSFWFRNAVPAFEQGFSPDTLSTDLYAHNILGPAFGLNNIMSKYLNIGMALNEIIFRTTQRPARVIHRPLLGTLSKGACADVAVLELSKGNFGFEDAGHARMDGSQKLNCVLTLREGHVVYDLNAITKPLWANAPSAYWRPPGVI